MQNKDIQCLIMVSLPLESNDWLVLPSYLSSKSRKLTYEKIQGMESGQTKLVFKYDL